MNAPTDGINITVEGPNITDCQLVAHHVGQYLQGTGFTDVTISQEDPLQFAEPSSQSDALQAIRRLNPGLFDAPINIDASVWSYGAGMPQIPDEPEAG